MQREAPQHFRLNHPMLVELRGKLHEITCDMSAGNHGIGDVGKHPVQSVAEFVNSVRASSTLNRLASPSPPLAKFITLTTIGSCRRSSFSWPRKLLIHAPLRFDGRAK